MSWDSWRNSYDAWKLATPPEYEEEDEQEYWESADEYDPEPEDMTDDDWAYWLEVVGT